jgi:hypothetical protein
MKAGSTNPIWTAATLHFARTPDAFDAESNRRKCDDPSAGLIQRLLRASVLPQRKLTPPETHQSQRHMKEKHLHNK